MKIKKVAIGLMVSVALGVGVSWGYAQVVPQQNIVSADDGAIYQSASQATSVDEASAKVSFKVKKLKKFPFKVDGSYGMLKKHTDGLQVLETTYVNKDSHSYITLGISQQNVELNSQNYEVKTIQSSVLNADAQFMDNGKVQMLYWKQDNLSYSLHAFSGSGSKFTADELIEIAASLE